MICHLDAIEIIMIFDPRFLPGRKLVDGIQH